MKNEIQKLISKTMVAVLISSQLGCGNKVLTTPLNRAQFDSNYQYSIHAVENTELPNVPGANIQNLPDRIHITQNNQTKYLLHEQIKSIDGESYQAVGSKTLEGMAWGALVGAPTGAVTFYAITAAEECNDGSDECAFNNLMGGVFGLLIGSVGGGLIGAGIGAAIPQKQKIQITPTFAPTSNGISGGANLQVNF